MLETVPLWILIAVAALIAALSIVFRTMTLPGSFGERQAQRRELRRKIRESQEKFGPGRSDSSPPQ